MDEAGGLYSRTDKEIVVWGLSCMGDANYNLNIKIQAISNFGKITKNLTSQLESMQKKINAVNHSTKSTSTSFDKLGTSIRNLSFVVIPAFTLAMRNFLKEGMNYEVAIRDLSALTGIQGKRLDELSEKATSLSKQWGLAADNIVNGMKRIASNKSEFIEIEGAIEGVAEKAAVLSRASGITFYKAGEVITATMNQYGLGLKDADRIINTFAEGAKLGSFEVEKSAQVFSRAGGALSSVGASFEDAMAATMVGSRLGLTGEMVGTQLKTAMLRLVARDNPFNPLEYGFIGALENIKASNATPAQLTALFGAESFQVGQALLNNLDILKKWKAAISDTDTAYKQSQTNMDTLSAKIDQVRNKFRALERDWFFNEKTYDTLEKIIDKIDEFLEQSTPKMRALAAVLKYTAVLVGMVIAVEGIHRLWKALLLVKGVLTSINGLLQFQVGKGIFGVFPRILASIKSIGTAIETLVASPLAKLIASLVAIVGYFKGMWTAFTDSGDLILKQWAVDKQKAVITIYKTYMKGLLEGLVYMGKLIVAPFVWIEETIGRIKNKTYTSKLPGLMDLSLNYYRSLDSTEALQAKFDAQSRDALLKQYREAHPFSAFKETQGTIKLVVSTENGFMSVKEVSNTSKQAIVDVGNTSVVSTNRNLFGDSDFGYQSIYAH